jgi:HAD superfamily hydrolase (TIGR01509 family)
MNQSLASLSRKVARSSLCIFDLDGTLVNLEQLNYGDFQKIIKEHFGITPSNEEYQRYFSGRGSLTGFQQYLTARNLTGEDAQVLQREFIAKKRTALTNDFQNQVKIQKGAQEFLSILKQKNINTVLATSTGREFCKLIMNRTGLRNYFDSIINREDVVHIKPDPEIFMKALEQFSTPAADAIVFEDSINGIEAAHAAKIYCIGFHNPGMNDGFIALSDAVIESYTELVMGIRGIS